MAFKRNVRKPEEKSCPFVTRLVTSTVFSAATPVVIRTVSAGGEPYQLLITLSPDGSVVAVSDQSPPFCSVISHGFDASAAFARVSFSVALTTRPANAEVANFMKAS